MIKSHTRCEQAKVGWIVLFLSVLVLGCDSGDGRFSIQGQVRYEGTSVQDGKILFLPANESLSQAVAEISDGKYSVDGTHGVFEGDYRVQIYAYRGTGEVIDLGPLYGNEKREKRVQFLPEKYNLNSELTVTISAQNEGYDFDLVE